MGMLGGLRDKLLIGVLGLLWFGLVVYSNYTDMFRVKTEKKEEPVL
jgi:hypothetical protein